MVITQASQACDAGSIPVARSKKRTAMVNRHCRFSFIGLKPKRRNRTDEVEFSCLTTFYTQLALLAKSDATKWKFQSIE